MAIWLIAAHEPSNAISMDKPTAGSAKKQWATADSLKNAGMPQMALPIVDSLYIEARKFKNQPMMIKAIIYKIALWSEFEEDHLEKGIALFDSEIKKADLPSFSILHSLQGELYWRYFEQNRYRILERTALTTQPGNDIKTWDARAILHKASQHYQLSLKDADELKKTGVHEYYDIIEKEQDSKRFRPTLFDLLGHRALDFYMQEEPYSMPATKSFILDDEIFFGDAHIFANLDLENPGEEAFLYYAIETMRQLTGLHLNRKEPFALVDMELKRLSFVRQKYSLAHKDSLYMQALQRLETKYRNEPVFTDVAYAIASEFERIGNTYDPFTNPLPRLLLLKAKEKCETAKRDFPDEPATKNCSILLENLQKLHLSIETEYVCLPGKPIKASVTFKNTSDAYFRLLKIEPGKDRKLRESNPTPQELMNAFLALPVVRQWEQALPPNNDMQQHRTEISISPLPVGYYVMLTSPHPEFASGDPCISWVTFWVSSIAFMHRELEDGSTAIRVMHRQSGKPMPNVTAIAYSRQYQPMSRNYELKQEKSYTTNRNGSFFIPPKRHEGSSNFIIEFKTFNDRLFTDNYFYQYRQDPVRPAMHLQSHLFTDRALYRPGQTVYYKGIMVESDGETHRAAKNIKTNVALYDANYEKTSEHIRTSNEFGSFSGSFVLPLSGLNGYHQIITQHGSVGFTVDEYRLPRFEVVFDTLRESYKLGEILTVSGQAKAYAGNPIGGAEVRYRITRQARFPFWRYWSRAYFPASPEAEILNGTVMTNPDGKFTVVFRAVADPNVPKEQSPVFTYNVTAEATDIQGETQAGNTTISIGYKALLLETNVEQNLNRDVFQGLVIKANNLNGQPQEATVAVAIQKLKSPDKILRNRPWAQPDQFVLNKQDHDKLFPHDVYGDDKNPEMWEIEREVLSESILTGSQPALVPDTFRSWEPGVYRLELKTKDIFGETIEHTRHFTLFSPGIRQMPSREIWLTAPIVTKGKPGEKAQVLIGSSLNLHVLMEVELKGKIVETRQIRLKNNTLLIEIPILKEHFGGFRLLFSSMALNRAFHEAVTIEVPDTRRQLDIKLETMRSKLEPGSNEELSIVIKDGEGTPAIAELLAGMYDAALDAIVPHAWALNIAERGYRWLNWSSQYAFGLRNSNYFFYENQDVSISYFRDYDQLNWFGFNFNSYTRYGIEGKGGGMVMARMAMAQEANDLKKSDMSLEAGPKDSGRELPQIEVAPKIEPTKTQALIMRRDFRETAFFFPHLKTDQTGSTKIQFTLPESLTRWKMMGLAHDKELRKGNLVQEFESSRQVMVVANAPRFFRQGDQTTFQAKVVNTTDQPLDAEALLELFDATTMQPLDSLFGLQTTLKRLAISANNAVTVGWEISIPEKGPFALVYRVRAMAGSHSDGEENILPVLTNRQLVTESMPLFVNAGESRSFSMPKLFESGKPGTTSINHKLTLEFVTNPVWYAVQALPFLSAPCYRSADALFQRFYANKLASYIINSNPEIERIFEVWSKTQPDALLSNLEKNQDLKNIVLEETPWLMDARRESENKRKIALMFDRNSIETELKKSATELMQMQFENGGWPWMPGMHDNQYITCQIVAGFGRLRALGAIKFSDHSDLTSAMKMAVNYLDNHMAEEKDRMNIKEEGKYLSHGAIQYLWARSYFYADYPLGIRQAQMFDFWIGQATKFWPEQPLYLQGMIALTMQRAGKGLVAQQIVKSLKNKSLISADMGMYWRDLKSGYFWHQAPIETQALLIEAFATIARDFESVQKMQQWLIKQKQTQAWKTNRATAEAIYAILMQEKSSLVPNKDISFTIGSKTIDPSKDLSISEEAGTGYFRISWNPSEIRPEMAKIVVNNKGKSIGWGGLYWQYFERLDRITLLETPLKLNRKIMRQSLTAWGPALEEVNSKTQLKIGDRMVMRIELRVDRDMEFVHMKDLRAPAFEPISQLSQYKYQDGLGYYENPRDAATHYFFQYLPKGAYVFEYPVFVSQIGNFSSGITSIECLYAPEFKAHSEGIRIDILKQ